MSALKEPRSIAGSSPLARGTRGFLHLRAGTFRLIPAHAGNTRSISSSLTACWAHPRSRGEHDGLNVARAVNQGSSPLARGTHRRIPHPTDHRRLIPARAGNTVAREMSAHLTGAHPRSRGEHVCSSEPAARKDGSSPLARGTLLRRELRRAVIRLIPARAGNTSSRHSALNLPRAHPRSRGEHINYSNGKKYLVGSSPLARGTRLASTARPL